MDFYTFSATAIPILWAASRFVQPQRLPRRWQAAGWLLLKVLLIGGEISAVVTIGGGHDRLFGAWTTALALVAGGLTVVVRPIAMDLFRLGVGNRPQQWSAVAAAVIVGVLTLRFA